MVRIGQVLSNEVKKFIKFVNDQNVQDNIIKRDEVRKIYNEQFKPSRQQEYQFSFRQMMRAMKELKEVHELGDFYLFGKDVQVLYERIVNDSEFVQMLEEWKKIAEENPFFCEICGIDCETEKSLEQHQLGNRHRIHKLHVDIYMQRQMMIEVPQGLRFISEPAVDPTGTMERVCKPKEKCTMTFEIENTMHDDVVVFKRYVFLWDTGVFKMYKGSNRSGRLNLVPFTSVRWPLHIQKGETRRFQIECMAPEDYGHHFVPLALYFVKKDSQTNKVITKQEDGAWTQDFVLRFVSVHVIGDMHDELKPKSEYKKPERIRRKEFEDTEPGEPLPEHVRNGLTGKLKPYPIPKHLFGYVNEGMIHKDERLKNLRDVKWTINSVYLSKILDCAATPRIYATKFHHLLWIEEIQMKIDIERYDLNSVTMEIDRRTSLMKLEVPGLAERRPSVLRGDRMYISIHDNHSGNHLVDNFGSMSLNAAQQLTKRRRFEGIVHKVEQDCVLLGVSAKLKRSWLPGKRYDVEFSVSPSNMWVQHRAIESSGNFNDLLFPSALQCGATEDALRPWFDKTLNQEQQTAVTNIVHGTSRPAPYIIFGPPGTGKTVTVTEAIKQVYDGQKDSRILVCCPENNAADFLMRKLLKTGPVLKKDMFRMCAISRAREAVHPDIMASGQHNYDKENDCFYFPTVGDLKNYRIVVVTLMSSGRMVSGKFPKNHFTHIFIDEGGHAVEPECIVPITGLTDAIDVARRPQLVIAGDPKQLGPIIRSSIAQNFGLPISLMERLMTDIELYSKNTYDERSTTKHYDERYITKLIRNYRSHDSILAVPRSLFYDNELQACGDKVILDSMLDWEMLEKHNTFPIIFHAVFGTDEREGNSPSWFNRDEVAQVDAYLKSLLKDKKGRKLKPSDIGIISPYRKQVDKIREMVTTKKYVLNRNEIAVGSVEEFQGQEFNVIIISTVRSNKDSSYYETDMIFNLGFLRNPKRFNVAVTRARSLLIVIGNPITLEQDPCWKAFIDHCEKNNAFKGQKGKLPPDHGLKTSATAMSRVVIPDDNPSLMTQVEDPAWERRD